MQFSFQNIMKIFSSFIVGYVYDLVGDLVGDMGGDLGGILGGGAYNLYRSND